MHIQNNNFNNIYINKSECHLINFEEMKKSYHSLTHLKVWAWHNFKFFFFHFRMTPICPLLLPIVVFSLLTLPGITTRELLFERVESFLNLERRLLSEAFFRSEKKVDYGRFHTSKRICRLLCDLCKAESRRLGTLCIQQCHEPNRMDGAISICRTRVSVWGS